MSASLLHPVICAICEAKVYIVYAIPAIIIDISAKSTFWPLKMPPRKNLAVGGDVESWILVWRDAMIEVFLKLLEEAHDNGKRSDTGFKPEAWVGFRAGIQAVYQGDEHIITGKIRSKLDFVCIHNRFFVERSHF